VAGASPLYAAAGFARPAPPVCPADPAAHAGPGRGARDRPCSGTDPWRRRTAVPPPSAHGPRSDTVLTSLILIGSRIVLYSRPGDIEEDRWAVSKLTGSRLPGRFR